MGIPVHPWLRRPPVTVVQHHRTQVPIAFRPQSAVEYAQILTERLDTGRIYDRDLSVLTPAVTALLDAMRRRVR